jgi:hypothetical protein
VHQSRQANDERNDHCWNEGPTLKHGQIIDNRAVLVND